MQKKVLIVGKLAKYAGDGLFARSSILVLTAPFNADVIALHKKEHVDLIITELDSPGLRGDELCTRIRADQDIRAVSIILVADNTPAHATRAKNAHANGILMMPFPPEALAERAVALLDIPKRQSYRVITNIKVEGHDDSRIIVCITVNISASGFLIETDKPLLVGDVIIFSFFLPGMKRITSRGEVMRVVKSPSGDFNYGVRFLSLTGEDRISLEAFVKSRQ